MISSFREGIDSAGEFILRLTYPHQRNSHRPLAIQSSGLFIFLLVLLTTQLVTNFVAGSDRLLGYATNISAGEVIQLSNIERQSLGLSPLTHSSSLAEAAKLKAKDMFQKNYWAHISPGGTSPWYFFGLVGYQYSSAGENLARDFATSSGVVTAWMASSGHKANILNSNFSEIGVAVVDGNLQGESTTLVVQLFGKPLTIVASSPQNQTSTPTKLETELKLPTQTESIVEEEMLVGTDEPQVGTINTQQRGSSILSLVKNTSQSQRVTIALLLLLSALMIVDSVVIFRKRHHRVGSHSFAHTSVIILLAFSSLLYGIGTIL